MSSVQLADLRPGLRLVVRALWEPGEALVGWQGIQGTHGGSRVILRGQDARLEIWQEGTTGLLRVRGSVLTETIEGGAATLWESLTLEVQPDYRRESVVGAYRVAQGLLQRRWPLVPWPEVRHG